MTTQNQTPNIETIRNKFPILQTKIHNHPLIYLDNASTTQKPQQVIQSIVNYYQTYNSNIHRSINTLAAKATTKVEQARTATKKLINAKSESEIIFTHNTTDSINLIANTYGKENIKQNHNIIISHSEHHSNITPWQTLCQQKKATLQYIPTNQNGQIDIKKLKNIINENTKIISISHVTNAIGNTNPIQEIIQIAQQNKIVTIIDAAQSIAYTPINVQKLNCDFLVFSSHKMYGPTGVGILYGKKQILDKMPPYRTGGNTIKEVTTKHTSYQNTPHKFEAGTPNTEGIIGHNEAINFITQIGINNIHNHITNTQKYAYSKLEKIKQINIITPKQQKSSIISFNTAHLNPIDISMLLDAKGIQVRAGTHCAQPIMNHTQNPQGTIRISFAIYNQKQEIDQLTKILQQIINKQCKQ